MPDQISTWEISHFLKLILVENVTGNHKATWLQYIENRRLFCSEDGKYLEDNIDIKVLLVGNVRLKKDQQGVCRHGEIVMEMKGRASANTVSQTVKFSNGYIVVENPWKGQRIGTYMMNRLVDWAVTNYPTYQPVAINLLAHHAQTFVDKARRNRFYEGFKFRFIWKDNNHCAGTLDESLLVSELRTTEEWKSKVTEYSASDAMKDVLEELAESDRKFRTLESQLKTVEFELQRKFIARFDTLLRKRRQLWFLGGVLLGIALPCGYALLKTVPI